jgi:hypothetical protein
MDFLEGAGYTINNLIIHIGTQGSRPPFAKCEVHGFRKAEILVCTEVVLRKNGRLSFGTENLCRVPGSITVAGRCCVLAFKNMTQFHVIRVLWIEERIPHCIRVFIDKEVKGIKTLIGRPVNSSAEVHSHVLLESNV